MLFHFTHMDNLRSIAELGLVADVEMAASEEGFVEVANQDIKARRRDREVSASPHGRVSEYVPFYFAARSPMLYAIHMGNVRTFAGAAEELVYLVTDIAAIESADLPFVFSDRNAALRLADYSNDLSQLDSYVDWQTMEGRWFTNTESEPDRTERRMAEFLVHRHVPWSAMIEVGTMTESRTAEASAIIEGLGHTANVVTRSDWYF